MPDRLDYRLASTKSDGVHHYLPEPMNKCRLHQGFLAVLKSVSIDPAVLLCKSGLPPNLCGSGDRMISPEQYFRLWYTLGEVSDDPAIGLRLATLNPPHQPAAIATQHARTFGDALQFMARSANLNSSEPVRIVKTKNECSIEFTGAC
jgi:AraC-type transcriptional regulator